MKDEHRIAYFSRGIFLRGTQGVIVQLDLRQALAGLELEIFHHIVAFLRRGIVGSPDEQGSKHKRQYQDWTEEFHWGLLKFAFSASIWVKRLSMAIVA